jgi:hypothetical protein
MPSPRVLKFLCRCSCRPQSSHMTCPRNIPSSTFEWLGRSATTLTFHLPCMANAKNLQSSEHLSTSQTESRRTEGFVFAGGLETGAALDWLEACVIDQDRGSVTVVLEEGAAGGGLPELYPGSTKSVSLLAPPPASFSVEFCATTLHSESETRTTGTTGFIFMPQRQLTPNSRPM